MVYGGHPAAEKLPLLFRNVDLVARRDRQVHRFRVQAQGPVRVDDVTAAPVRIGRHIAAVYGDRYYRRHQYCRGRRTRKERGWRRHICRYVAKGKRIGLKTVANKKNIQANYGYLLYETGVGRYRKIVAISLYRLLKIY